MGVGGGTLSDTWCATNGNDVDGDGVDEHCEFRLAWTFRPEMRSYKWDDVSGEPYYAVEKIDGRYRILYMLGYYEDFGYTSTWHPFTSPGHIGDSEFVILDVTYEPSTQHWVLDNAILSCHYLAPSVLFVGFDCTQAWAPQHLDYPEDYRWYPRIHVSVNKHANYPSDSSCDSGQIGAEDCPSPSVTWRVPVAQAWNVGSWEQPAPDNPHNAWGNAYTCVQSRDEQQRVLFGRSDKECFWDNGPVDFGAWMPVVTGVTSYSVILEAFGFRYAF